MQKSKYNARKENSIICKRRVCYDHVRTFEKYKNGIAWQDTNIIHAINRLGSRNIYHHLTMVAEKATIQINTHS